ncbi:formate--tetrahydrofolate ligase [Nocardioides euryhalodurans]|uniref:Formate--tetrahydrofolate ligase n=1 Tax=Nocardioides euryhalodurans TaxID=2518370 RepID=A0A4P7GK93_9ACTN|nr:formate--tetrahydrofolate ligase [Nocardioides euryhalodurans]QBR92091.1 formate--tetrahydrofolate ligase [Nocardioides euryhalodurans]
MLHDSEIAEAAELWPIARVAHEMLGVPDEALIPYGRHMAKLDRTWLSTLDDAPLGRLVLVTGISPTPAGEGKTTTVVGLTDGLRQIGVKAAAALREPSMGPVFGMKGGAAGGGYAQVVPMTEINLHFTGDFAAIAAANNLLAALLDNHLHHGNALDIDPRTITWRRVLDVNDRSLRDVVTGLGGTANGVPREDAWDIVVASELMAIFCLATSLTDLKERIGRIVLAHTRDGSPVTAAQLEAQDALTILLAGALQPNLVQTLEHSPAFVHGGPFANIAHGCSSVLATRTALQLNDVVVTEAGFGADLGAEKFFDLKCRLSGLRPGAAVVVATVRALKHHGGVPVAETGTEDLEALRRGGANLRRHLQNLRDVFGVPAVVAINRFPNDTEAEIEVVREIAESEDCRAVASTHAVDGGAGAVELAEAVQNLLDKDEVSFSYCYPDEGGVVEKAEAVARRVYRAEGVGFSKRALKQLDRIEADGLGHLPVCFAKTQYSFSTDPKALGAPEGHTVDVRDVRLSAGAGFVVLVAGEVMTMPGLPKVPASARMTIDGEGHIRGLS